MNFNPLQAMLQNMGQPRQQINNNIPFDPEKFRQGISGLTKENLAQLVNQARAKGIPEEQIEQGLNFILKMR